MAPDSEVIKTIMAFDAEWSRVHGPDSFRDLGELVSHVEATFPGIEQTQIYHCMHLLYAEGDGATHPNYTPSSFN